MDAFGIVRSFRHVMVVFTHAAASLPRSLQPTGAHAGKRRPSDASSRPQESAMSFRRIATTATLLALSVTAASVQAATATTTFNVRVTITAACDISTTAPTDVNFGTQPSTATNTDNQGALNVNCTPSAPYTIALDNGQNGTDANTRKMSSGTAQVPYQLYRAATRTSADVWGSTTGTGGNTYAGTGSGTVQTVPVYGRVPSSNFPAGSYADVITATITY
jgi:spore coat protein U-like protein